MAYRRLILALVVLLIVAPDARSQTSQPDRHADERREADRTGDVETPDALLAGPRVDEADRPDDRTGFSVRGRDRPAARGRIQRWFRLLRTLDLTPAQQEQARAVMAEMETARRTFQAEHGDELRELQQAARSARQERRPLEDPTRERLMELQTKAPAAATYQARLWAMLTASQQDALVASLRAMEADRASGRDGDAATSMTDSQMGATSRPSTRDTEDGSIARRRLEFLRSRRSQHVTGAEPTSRERVFEFDEDDG